MATPCITSITRCLCAAIVLFSLAGQAAAQAAQVAAASSLRTLWPELASAYTTETDKPAPGTSFASSGLLSTQITHGAPFHIFLSADDTSVNKLHDSGRILEQAMLLATGEIRLARLSSNDRMPGSEHDNDADPVAYLSAEGFRLAIPNPVHAPYGVAARQALSTMGLWPESRPAEANAKRFRGEMLTAENAAQTLQFLRSGAVDAAIIPWSLVFVNNENLSLKQLPSDSYTPVRHLAVRINLKSDSADHFWYWLMTSERVRTIFQQHGLKPMFVTL